MFVEVPLMGPSILGTEDRAVNKTDGRPCSHETGILYSILSSRTFYIPAVQYSNHYPCMAIEYLMCG